MAVHISDFMRAASKAWSEHTNLRIPPSAAQAQLTCGLRAKVSLERFGFWFQLHTAVVLEGSSEGVPGMVVYRDLELRELGFMTMFTDYTALFARFQTTGQGWS